MGHNPSIPETASDGSYPSGVSTSPEKMLVPEP